MLMLMLARGPEVETWIGAPEGTDPAVDNDWSLLPFMALSDGAHAYVSLDFAPYTLIDALPPDPQKTTRTLPSARPSPLPRSSESRALASSTRAN